MRAPENTLAAFRTARETGGMEIETDVRLTLDGVPVICHDDTLRRYGHGERRIEEHVYDELARLDFGSWFSPAFAGERLLRLEVLLAEFQGDFFYHIELKGKCPQLAAKTLELVRSHGLLQQCVFTSFSREQLVRARGVAKDVRLGWLVKHINESTLAEAKILNLFQLCPHAKNITRESVKLALETVTEVRAWGCPRNKTAARATVARLCQSGICGITIDEPLWVAS